MEKPENIKRKTEKWCSLHNRISNLNEGCYQQKSGSKCKDSSTVVDGKNSETHEAYVVESTNVDCNLCCCNGKTEKKSNESEVKYYQYLILVSLFPFVIYCSSIKQTDFSC